MTRTNARRPSPSTGFFLLLCFGLLASSLGVAAQDPGAGWHPAAEQRCLAERDCLEQEDRVVERNLSAEADRVAGEDSVPERDAGAELVKKVLPAVVSVLAYNPDRAMPSIGTGFFIAPDTVATVRHVFGGTDRAEVRTWKGQTIRVVGIIAEDPARDLVLIRLETPVREISPLVFSRKLPELGQKVLTISSPMGLEWSVSAGVVAGIRELPKAGPAIQHTAAVSPGSSGCPLVNSAGEVVALQTATITTGDGIVQAGQSLNFASPALNLAALVPGPVRALAECAEEIPAGWIPDITREVDAAGLRPFTRDDFRGALPLFEEAVRRQPDEPDAWFRLGLCREKVGNLDGSLEAYVKAIGLRPDFAVALNNLGVLYFRKGLHGEAADALRRAVAARPGNVETLVSLARAAIGLERFAEAAGAARKAVERSPDHADARFLLGTAYARSAETEKARVEYEALLKLRPELAEKLKPLLEIRWS